MKDVEAIIDGLTPDVQYVGYTDIERANIEGEAIQIHLKKITDSMQIMSTSDRRVVFR
jgi:hypothetical protein